MLETVSVNFDPPGGPWEEIRLEYDPEIWRKYYDIYEDELFERSCRLGSVRHVSESKLFESFSFDVKRVKPKDNQMQECSLKDDEIHKRSFILSLVRKVKDIINSLFSFK